MQELVDNRYRVVEPLGRGGMAEVFLARDEASGGREVALKVMRRQYAEEEEFVERFRREAVNASALSHPNIVAVYGRGESGDGTHYIVMEYVPGGTLKQLIEREAPLPVHVAAAVAVQVAEALRAAHGHGIVHRDIKPQNVLLTGSGVAKVTDFGIARAAAATTITRTDFVLGSAHYLSPEQAIGRQVDRRSDLYSLGVTMYEMLTGQLPYGGETPGAIMMQHVNGRLRSPKDVNGGIPDWIDTVVGRLLSKDPAGRYANAGELLRDLQRGAGISSVPDLVGQSLGRADATLARAHLTVGGQGEAYSDAVPAGEIVGQNLEAGTTVAQGTRVSVTVSRGSKGGATPQPTRRMSASRAPTRIGGNPNDARRGRTWSRSAIVPSVVVAALGVLLVSAVGLMTPETDTQGTSSGEGSGQPGQEAVPSGREDGAADGVPSVSSESYGEVEVPNVVGKSSQEAIREISNAGLVWGEVKFEQSTRPFNTVVSTDPPAGSTVRSGTEITVTISRDPAGQYSAQY